jgi:hypothetical protein
LRNVWKTSATMPWTMPTCGAITALEIACHVAVRSETFHAKTFYGTRPSLRGPFVSSCSRCS